MRKNPNSALNNLQLTTGSLLVKDTFKDIVTVSNATDVGCILNNFMDKNRHGESTKPKNLQKLPKVC